VKPKEASGNVQVSGAAIFLKQQKHKN